MQDTPSTPRYRPQREPQSRWITVRGLRYHLWEWGDDTSAPAATGVADQPLLVMAHGWADIGASFQFVVDALAACENRPRHVIAPDWRGFGLSQDSGADAYWFPDYLGDLDALLDAVSPGRPVDLLGHSMGGNVVMSYAGVRPQRIRRLVNLEGFGLPRTQADKAPKRLAEWLDELKKPQAFRGFDDEEEVAARLRANNPRLAEDKARWLAPHWAARGADGRWHVRCDPAHKRVNPVLYQVDEVLATWRHITAPTLWVEGTLTDISGWWGHRYSKAEFHERLSVVPAVRREQLDGCGHMLHHDRPEALAALLADFLR